jgi:DNA-binding NtrC family response regulator
LSLDATSAVVKLLDLDSTNGTFVNGVHVVQALLRGGEEITLGNTVLRLERAPSVAPRPGVARDGFGKLVGKSPAMQRIYPLLERLAQSAVPVVIEGETGTGKEMAAESLHAMGPRANGPYVVFDCTAVPPSLAEAELFGHERGAFTGAVGARPGVFEQAHGGTLLIDEIGDLELRLQPKLLRAIERGEIRRLGATKPTRVDVRLIAATRRELDQLVQSGRFRDDLFHRLAVARVELPPLSARAQDVELLTHHFFREFASGPPPASLLARFRAQRWPGNVRELRNAVARHLALGELADATAQDDSAAIAGDTDPAEDFIARVLERHVPLPVARATVVSELERRYIQRVLAEHDGNVAKAAAASGIALRYFQLLRSGKRRR